MMKMVFLLMMNIDDEYAEPWGNKVTYNYSDPRSLESSDRDK